MDPYINEWLNLVVRFAHLITGIAWIGASFYFVWLDNHLETPPPAKAEKGIGGDQQSADSRDHANAQHDG